MNWNTTYHIYEGIALLWIVATWGAMVFKPAPTYEADFKSVTINLKHVLAQEDEKHCNWIENLCIDVDKQGRSREGLERIERAHELDQRLNQVHAKIRQERKQLTQNTSSKNIDWGQEKVARVTQRLNTQLNWMNTEFKDLNLNLPFEHIVKNDSIAHFTNTTKAAAQALLLTYQLQLKRYESQVLRKLGAGDFSFSYGCGFGWGINTISEAYVVQVGDDYVADMFDNLTTRRLFNIKYFVNDQALPIDKRGDFELKTQGVGRQYLHLTFHYRDREGGRVQSIEKRIPYTVLPK
ncbi:hypothetical protein BKI52_28935 [marine bacterium AO1-C]|nr:hypothetical protein BKI52_28935 [marine bacterium AO1-C]